MALKFLKTRKIEKHKLGRVEDTYKFDANDAAITAKDILYKNMIFYDTKAMKLAQHIIKLVKSQDKSRGDLLVVMHKEMGKFNDRAIDCATKLAPYTHAKLQSVEVKNTVEHRFVVRTPTAIKSSSEWLENCSKEGAVIELTPTKSEIN
jgi:hypothetical protein